MESESSNLLISFIGASPYKDSKYNYPDTDLPIECKYGTTAFIAYLKEKENININKLLICGTSSSFWHMIPEYFLETADRIFAGNAHLDEIKNKLQRINGDSSSLEFKDIIETNKKSSVPGNRDKFLELWKQCENSLNDAIRESGMTVFFIEHAEEFSEYDKQIELLNRIKDSGLIDSSTSIYLDITYGLRIMPFMTFISFQSLCYTENLHIKKICYSPEYMPKTEPVERLAYIESVKNRLRYLKNTELNKYNDKLEVIKGILKPAKNTSPQQKTTAIRDTYCCFLDSTEEMLNDAALINRYNATYSPAVFAEKIPETVKTQDDKSLRDILKEISYFLNISDYEKSAELLLQYKESIINTINNNQITAKLSSLFDWAQTFSQNQEVPQEQGASLKMLAGIYLDENCYDYIHAINCCYSAIEDYEYSSYNPTGYCEPYYLNELKKKKREKITKRYKKYNEFIELYRSMFVHLEDKTKDIDIDEARIHKFIKVDDNNQIDEKNLREKILEPFKSLEVKFNQKQRTPGHVMFTFIGSGDYGHTSYTYCNPFHRDEHYFDVTGSRALGISLARKLRDIQKNVDVEDTKLTRLVVCGTITSNWRTVMESLDQEFLQELSTNNPDIRKKFISIKDEIITHLNDTGNTEGQIDVMQITTINDFFQENRDIIGFDIIFAVTADTISNPETQREIIDCITRNVDTNDLISFDITHSYRIIPIISLCAFLYLKAVKHNEIRHIFYGDVPLEGDFNFLKGLKKSQLSDEDVFLRYKEQIEAVLSDVTDEELLCGKVYDMRNLAKLLEYSASINQYIATNNLIFLQPLIKIELRKRDFYNYVNFQNGVLLNSMSFFEAAAEFLEPAVDRLREGFTDPVLDTLKDKIFTSLSWIEDILSETQDKTINTLIKKARLNIESEDFIKAFCCCYQAMVSSAQNLRKCIIEFRKENIISISDDDKSFIIIKPIDSGLKTIIEKINNKNRYRKHPVQLKDAFITSPKNEDAKNRKLSAISGLIFTHWGYIKNLRNMCFHHESTSVIKEEISKKSNKNNINGPEKIREFIINKGIPDIKTVLGCIKDMQRN